MNKKKKFVFGLLGFLHYVGIINIGGFGDFSIGYGLGISICNGLLEVLKE